MVEKKKREYEKLDSRSGWSCLPKRYILAILMSLGYVGTYTTRIQMSIAIVAMTTNTTGNDSNVRPGGRFDWNLELQGYILTAVYWGNVITQYPGGLLAKRFGGTVIFGLGVLGTALCSILVPWLSSWGVYAVIAIRFLQGSSGGVTTPAMMEIWSRWAPVQEKTNLLSLTSVGMYLGCFIGLFVSGLLVETPIGWPLIFYFFGGLIVIWYIMWYICIYETPELHTTISEIELDYLRINVPQYHTIDKKSHKTPWCSILTSLPFWSLVVVQFAVDWGLFTLMSDYPTFMDNALYFEIRLNGLLTALPFLFTAFVVAMSGRIADCLINARILSTTQTRKLFSTGVPLFLSVCTLTAGIYSYSAVITVICLTLTLTFQGAAWSSVIVNFLDLSPSYSTTLVAISNGCAFLTGIIGPVITGTLVNNGGREAWSIVFYITAALYLVASVLYLIIGSGETQKWDSNTSDIISEE